MEIALTEEMPHKGQNLELYFLALLAVQTFLLISQPNI
jgi:hypothetical protein